jgi:prepilin-type N-terminal cleavage/methylation domain-containing protein
MKIKGFTLIELVIVMIIIGILASIALPQFGSILTKSKQAEAYDVLARMYKGYRGLLADGVINVSSGNFADGSVFNPDESDILPNSPNGRSDLSWKALGFEKNSNYLGNAESKLYFSYDFLKVGENSNLRSVYLGARPTCITAPWAIAYRKISNSWIPGTELFPVNYDERIYIYLHNGTIVKSSPF